MNLFRSEWLKLRKRPLTWILLVVFLAMFVLQFAAQVFVASAADLVTSNRLQLEEYRRRVLFPGVYGAVFSHINGVGGIFAVVLTAGALGSEYGWGTLRTHLSRYPNRVGLLLSKLAAVLALLVLAMLLNLALGVGLGLAVMPLVGSSAVSEGLAGLPMALLRALYVLLPYVLLTACFTVIWRSLLVGVAGGLAYLVFELGFGALATFAQLGGLWAALYRLTIGQNINALVLQNSHSFGLRPELVAPGMDPAALPSPALAALVIGVYCAVFLATALHFFFHRDITGSS